MTFLPQDRAVADALWEDNKDTLRKLYISKNMTLDQVRGIMAEFHNFEAMYKFHVFSLLSSLTVKYENSVYFVWY